MSIYFVWSNNSTGKNLKERHISKTMDQTYYSIKRKNIKGKNKKEFIFL